MTTLITDIDDTLVDFASAFSTWVKLRGLPTTCETLQEAQTIPKFLGLEREVADGIIHDYAYHDNHFGELPAYPDARLVISKLKHTHTLIAISACVEGREVTHKRRRNLEDAFECDWQAVHCVGLGESKAPILEAYAPAVWVEDNLHHAIVGAEIGHRSFLMDRSYNQGPAPGVTRVKSWLDIYAHLRESGSCPNS